MQTSTLFEEQILTVCLPYILATLKKPRPQLKNGEDSATSERKMAHILLPLASSEPEQCIDEGPGAIT